MMNILSLIQTIFNYFLLGCGFLIVCVLTGFMELSDILIPLQNFMRG